MPADTTIDTPEIIVRALTGSSTPTSNGPVVSVLTHPGYDLAADYVEPAGGDWVSEFPIRVRADGKGVVNWTHAIPVGLGQVEHKAVAGDTGELILATGLTDFFQSAADLNGIDLTEYESPSSRTPIGRYTADDCLRAAADAEALVRGGYATGVSIEFRPNGPKGSVEGEGAYWDREVKSPMLPRPGRHFKSWTGLAYAHARRPVNPGCHTVVNDIDVELVAKAIRVMETGKVGSHVLCDRVLKSFREDAPDLLALARAARRNTVTVEGVPPVEVKSAEYTDALPRNADGTVTVYHHTNKDAADRLVRTGIIRSAGEPHVYVTTHQDTDTGYGDTAVPIHVHPDLLELDDEFPNGRLDFRISVGKPGGQRRVKVQPGFTVSKPDAGPAVETKGLEDEPGLRSRINDPKHRDTTPQAIYADYLEDHEPHHATPEVLTVLRGNTPVWVSRHPETGAVVTGAKHTFADLRRINRNADRSNSAVVVSGDVIAARNVVGEPYSGPGGVYFVGKSEKFDRTGNDYRTVRFHPETGRTSSVEHPDMEWGATFPTPAAAHARARQLAETHPATEAKAVLSTEIKARIPKKLYRGIIGDGTTGAGTYSLGKGLYSTPRKGFLDGFKFDKIIELGPAEAYPKKPLELRTPDHFTDWLLAESGHKNIREFNKQYADPGEFVRSKGYDGVVAGDEVVKYPEPKEVKAKSDAWIAWKVRKLIGEGKPRKQAVAIAYSMAGRDKETKASPDASELVTLVRGQWWRENGSATTRATRETMIRGTMEKHGIDREAAESAYKEAHQYATADYRKWCLANDREPPPEAKSYTGSLRASGRLNTNPNVEDEERGDDEPDFEIPGLDDEDDRDTKAVGDVTSPKSPRVRSPFTERAAAARTAGHGLMALGDDATTAHRYARMAETALNSGDTTDHFELAGGAHTGAARSFTALLKNTHHGDVDLRGRIQSLIDHHQTAADAIRDHLVGQNTGWQRFNNGEGRERKFADRDVVAKLLGRQSRLSQPSQSLRPSRPDNRPLVSGLERPGPTMDPGRPNQLSPAFAAALRSRRPTPPVPPLPGSKPVAPSRPDTPWSHRVVEGLAGALRESPGVVGSLARRAEFFGKYPGRAIGMTASRIARRGLTQSAIDAGGRVGRLLGLFTKSFEDDVSDPYEVARIASGLAMKTGNDREAKATIARKSPAEMKAYHERAADNPRLDADAADRHLRAAEMWERAMVPSPTRLGNGRPYMKARTDGFDVPAVALGPDERPPASISALMNFAQLQMDGAEALAYDAQQSDDLMFRTYAKALAAQSQQTAATLQKQASAMQQYLNGAANNGGMQKHPLMGVLNTGQAGDQNQPGTTTSGDVPPGADGTTADDADDVTANGAQKAFADDAALDSLFVEPVPVPAGPEVDADGWLVFKAFPEWKPRRYAMSELRDLPRANTGGTANKSAATNTAVQTPPAPAVEAKADEWANPEVAAKLSELTAQLKKLKQLDEAVQHRQQRGGW